MRNMNYKTHAIIDGKPRLIIVDDNGKTINKNPCKEELKSLETEFVSRRNTRIEKYNDTNTCDRCREKGVSKKLIFGKARRERDQKGNVTGRWTCDACYSMYDRYRIYEKPETYYNETNTCSKCAERGIIKELRVWNAYRERDNNSDITGRWICRSCYDAAYNDRPNSTSSVMKSIADSRTNNLDPNSTKGKGDKYQLLACKREGWEDLNKKNDNYLTSLDCYDPKTGVYHQIQGRRYTHNHWPFTNFEREWFKEFKDMICYCASKDGKIIERKYIFPSFEIIDKKSITITKNPVDRWGNRFTPWYEEYRVTDKEELKKDNDVWNKINETHKYNRR